jgi:hypothetical protein
MIDHNGAVDEEEAVNEDVAMDHESEKATENSFEYVRQY